MQKAQNPSLPNDAARQAVHGIGLAWREIDAAKGLLILLVAIGHSTLLTANVPHLFRVLYGFHVVGFLLLPFLFQEAVLSWRTLGDRAIRYLVPFLMFYLFTCAVFFLRYVPMRDLLDWLGHVAVGLLGSSALVKRASGFELFWFLPALFTLTLMRSVYHALDGAMKYVFLGMLVFAHPWIGALPVAAKIYLPWGMPIAVYLFPLGLLTAFVWRRFCVQNLRGIAVLSMFLFGCCALGMIAWGNDVNVSAVRVYAYNEPGKLVLQELLMVSGFVATLSIAPQLAKFAVFVQLGRYSLPIYLMHSLVYQAFLQICERFGFVPRTLPSKIALGGVLLAMTIAVAWGVARGLTSSVRLRRLLLPRSIEDWCAAFAR